MKERIEEQYLKIEGMKEDLADELYLHVEQLARAALQKHSQLKSFFMCMGVASFVVVDDTNDDDPEWEPPDRYISIDEIEVIPYAKDLHDLYEIMSNLKVTGRPMKIAGAFEPTLRDW